MPHPGASRSAREPTPGVEPGTSFLPRMRSTSTELCGQYEPQRIPEAQLSEPCRAEAQPTGILPMTRNQRQPE